MEFGKVNPSELDRINFHLPADNNNVQILLHDSKRSKPEIYIGGSRWGSKEWVGKIYPAKTKQADFLSHYAQHFSCIELNTTFYRMPTPLLVKTWKEKVGNEFKFCPKFLDQITHYRRLSNVRELTDQFLEAISAFGNNLGPVFLMPHPQMGPKALDIIKSFIEYLPTDLELFIELRHPDWFSNPETFEASSMIFKQLKTGLVITDASGRRDCVHMHLTKPEVFIRFVGNNLHPSDYARIDEWIQRIKVWLSLGLEKIWFIVHQPEELCVPLLSSYLISGLNKECETNIKNIQLIESPTLFG